MRLRRAGRRTLSHWEFQGSAPQGPDARPPAEGWRACGSASTAAAALGAVGQWSLEGARRDFDADDWWFRTSFDAGDAECGDAVLGFDGLATVAQAWLNGERIVDSANMFVAHERDVAPLLRRSGNELVVRSASLAQALQARRPRPRWRATMVAHQQLRWWRTTLLGRTPGWSPPAAVAGAWKDVWLEGGADPLATDVHVRTEVAGSRGVLHVSARLQRAERAEIELEREGRRWVAPLRFDGGRASGEVEIDGVQRWWPHTHGEPALYRATLRVRGTGAHEFALPPVGFRELALDTSHGGFAVFVNGERIFCRGAVWMPLDPVTLRAPDTAYAAMLSRVRGAGMNMLRVPGTTVYEEDAFYAACDAAGVLVWQDFMFANMDYPETDAGFVATVKDEVGQQLGRLHGHPCLAVLCGNSEVAQQAAMWGAPRASWQPALFHEQLPAWCAEHAPGVPYWPSSAHGGAFPHQPGEGTCSYYGVGAYRRPLEDARSSGLRFATECLAFANVPGPGALARMPGGAGVRVHQAAWKERSPRDLGAGWDFDDVRDHYLGLLFQLDPQQLRATDPERYLALSRIVPAEAMAASFSRWRTQPGCGGALVLMLRDLWAGAGWGLLDEQGGAKAAWHALARVLQPVALLVTDEGLNGLVAHVANDGPDTRMMQLEVTAWSGEACIARAQRPIEAAPRSLQAVPIAALLDHATDLNWAWRFGPPPCDVVRCVLLDAQGATIARTHHFCAGLPHLQHRGTPLRAQIRTRRDDGCEVAVHASHAAYGVHFDWMGMTADDEHFHLAPGETHTVMFRGGARGRGAVLALNAGQPAPILEGAE